MRSSGALMLGVVLVSCAAGPDGLKAVNLGYPPTRGLGGISVDPGGRLFVKGGSAVYELEGRIEDDTQVFVALAGWDGHELLPPVPGFGAAAADLKAARSLSRPSAEALPSLVGPTLMRPLLVEPDGTALAVGTSDLGTATLFRRAPGGTWTEIAGTAGPLTAFASAVRLADGRVYAFHGSRVYLLPAGVASASVAYDCDTRALGSCAGSASISGVGRLLPDGRLAVLVRTTVAAEVYAFRPADPELTRVARVGTSAINGQVYTGTTKHLAVDGAGNLYVAARTEPNGGEVHILAHRPGTGEDDWVTVATGLPRVVELQQDDAGAMWIWDGSDSSTGLWKLIPRSASCRACGE